MVFTKYLECSLEYLSCKLCGRQHGPRGLSPTESSDSPISVYNAQCGGQYGRRGLSYIEPSDSLITVHNASRWEVLDAGGPATDVNITICHLPAPKVCDQGPRPFTSQCGGVSESQSCWVGVGVGVGEGCQGPECVNGLDPHQSSSVLFVGAIYMCGVDSGHVYPSILS